MGKPDVTIAMVLSWKPCKGDGLLDPPISAGASLPGREEGEEGNQALARDQAAVSREPVTPCAAWRTAMQKAGWQASRAELVAGGGGRRGFMVVVAQAC